MDPGSAPSWQISKAADGVVHARFVGPTPVHEMARFLEALTLTMPSANARLVFDLTALGGYNSDTKEPIKAWLLRYKLAIVELTVVITKSSMILKMATLAIALATGIKISIREEGEALGPFALQ